jgi:hypothetical protein
MSMEPGDAVSFVASTESEFVFSFHFFLLYFMCIANICRATGSALAVRASVQETGHALAAIYIIYKCEYTHYHGRRELRYWSESVKAGEPIGF